MAAHAEAPGHSVVVEIGRFRAGHWRLLLATSSDAAGRWQARVPLPRPGLYALRARLRRQPGYTYEFGWCSPMRVFAQRERGSVQHSRSADRDRGRR